MLHNKDSLFYKVFKSKYFPNCSILDDGVKAEDPMLGKACRVVRLGSRWRIGDGKSVMTRGGQMASGFVF